jgi:hypothetical protein
LIDIRGGYQCRIAECSIKEKEIVCSIYQKLVSDEAYTGMRVCVWMRSTFGYIKDEDSREPIIVE